MKSGAKSGSGFRTRFWGPLILIGTLSAGSKNAPIFGPEFGRRGTFTLELAFGIANLGGADQKSVPDAVR